MNNTDQQYHDLLNDILLNGVEKKDRTGVGTLSVFGRMLKFNMDDGFPLLTTKKVWFKGVLHELLWFLSGQTNIKYLVDNDVNIWNEWAYEKYIKNIEKKTNKHMLIDMGSTPTIEEFIDMVKNGDKSFTGLSGEEFAELYGDLGPVYGKQWNDFKGVNQISNAIDMLSNNPDSRRILINAWNPSEINNMALPPCHYGFQFYSEEMTPVIRYQRFIKYIKNNNIDISGMSALSAMEHYNFPKRHLNLMWNQRSVDSFLGLPFNIASYGLLLHLFSQITNHVPNELSCNLGDTHIYLNHIEQVKLQLSRVGYKLPTISLNKNIDDIYNFKYNDINLINYKSHPTINAPIAV